MILRKRSMAKTTSDPARKLKRASMMPNEILLDVFAFLDRRTLETAVRLISPQFNALVGTMKKGPYIDAGLLETFAFYSIGDELAQHNLEPPPGDNAPTFRFHGLSSRPQFSLPEFTALRIPRYIRCKGLKLTMIWTADDPNVTSPDIPLVIAQLKRYHNIWAFPGCEEANAGALVPATNNSNCMRQIFEHLLPHATRMHITFAGWAGMNVFEMNGLNTFYKPLKLEGSENNRHNFEMSDIVNWLSRVRDDVPSTINRLQVQRNASAFNFNDIIPELRERFGKDTQRVSYYLEVQQQFGDELTAEDRALETSFTNNHTGETLSIYGHTPSKYFAIERRVAYE